MLSISLLPLACRFTAYKPMIRFPQRTGVTPRAVAMSFSGKKIKMTNREALNSAMREEMARDNSVYLMGEEVAQFNGAYKISKGLLD